ncbi:hypothetical protein [Aureimonas leprariae]|uniref:Uncharacterized protein n=1 Tax=Plantimonas leprariae TaxID=2615207 RepID=A0A7V7PKT9_9HYPH|nr:hypothetical protein [Aureimonas leprariae]KAB0676539.1 hypothetical protein F6X38_20855 [Aureimonas leprariae]
MSRLIVLFSMVVLLASNVADGANGSGRSKDRDTAADASREMETSTNYFCSAAELQDINGEKNHFETFYISQGLVDKPADDLPNLKLTVIGVDGGVKVTFHAIRRMSNFDVYGPALAMFYHAVRQCADIDPLWATKFELRKMKSVAFAGIDIVKGVDGPQFRAIAK